MADLPEDCTPHTSQIAVAEVRSIRGAIFGKEEKSQARDGSPQFIMGQGLQPAGSAPLSGFGVTVVARFGHGHRPFCRGDTLEASGTCKI